MYGCVWFSLFRMMFMVLLWFLYVLLACLYDYVYYFLMNCFMIVWVMLCDFLSWFGHNFVWFSCMSLYDLCVSSSSEVLYDLFLIFAMLCLNDCLPCVCIILYYFLMIFFWCLRFCLIFWNDPCYDCVWFSLMVLYDFLWFFWFWCFLLQLPFMSFPRFFNIFLHVCVWFYLIVFRFYFDFSTILSDFNLRFSYDFDRSLCMLVYAFLWCSWYVLVIFIVYAWL